ncbi:D-ribose pyranase [Corynebacterium aquilae]|uniref:D-ribose pyranase n=1 Tax=Corynebacterium aquilae DSM 44791 TaxID=1431546 RepID=A0A1L7CEY0_9CORY|nr:D-ribose pyranase [Corynebacterium aquilae]APT84387.1 hypothetical protein CAQU_04095 [Corynebacterium aquilae DSM 44791]
MKRSGLTNPQLLRAIAQLGHTDTFAIADAGLPIPKDVEVVDLSIDFGFPEFVDVAQRILPSIVAEKAELALEAPEGVLHVVSDQLQDAVIEQCSHEDLKRKLRDVKFVVRTGSVTPYANVIVHSGVPF